jgi:hypothetical protein
MASNSAAQRALYREREAAKAAGKLPEWYAARDAARQRDASRRGAEAPRYSVTFTPAPPASPFDNYEAIRTPETTVWREGERYPHFIMPYNTGRVVSGIPRNRF